MEWELLWCLFISAVIHTPMSRSGVYRSVYVVVQTDWAVLYMGSLQNTHQCLLPVMVVKKALRQ
jgi:hypothetical protein